MVAVVEDILGTVSSTKSDEKRAQIRSLQVYLDITETPDDDLANQADLKTNGSCSWFEDRHQFQSWQNGEVDQVQFYWLNARPATGKSVLSAHVIQHLLGLGLDCSYYFFKFGNKTKQHLGGLLRALAFQMSDLSASVRQTLFDLREDDVQFDKDDERAIWRKLFRGGIFKVKLQRTQYWIIDGLDECTNAARLFPLLAKIEVSFPLRIFITSRPSPELEKHFGLLGPTLISDCIRPQETMTDIRLYLKTGSGHLPVPDVGERQELVEKLLSKSNGCFLWVRLVLQELERVYSDEQIADVIDEMPEGMIALYERALDTMSHNFREKKLIQVILTWVVCATRPMTLVELQAALKIDLGITVRSMQQSIEALCGQLLYVNHQGTVQMVHATARDFLLDQDLSSDLAVKRDIGHLRLAETCLTYLGGEELRPPRNRLLQRSMRALQRSKFADYAAVAFAEHLSGASSADDKLLVKLTQFLNTNILSWIELIASGKQNLYVLIRTAKNLKAYLERRAKHVAPLGNQVQTVEAWSTDLIRLVAKFGKNVLVYPPSIHFMIPPFCPRESIVHRKFGKSHGGLTISGLSNSEWEDCVSYIEYRYTWATALACGASTFAIGMKSGNIILYDQATCQEKATFQHSEPVKKLTFDNLGHHLASSGNKHIILWNLAGQRLWKHRLDHACVDLAFSPNDDLLLAATRGSRVLRWDTSCGTLIRDEVDLSSCRRPSQVPIRQVPIAAALSPDLTTLALVYRGRPIQLWSLESDTFISLCGRDSGVGAPNISAGTALFNPDPALSLLAVAYQDGQLALYDPWTQEELNTVAGDALTLASSPDGRTLATGDARGVVQIWDFETLRLMYLISSSDYEVKSLAFSGDGLRIVDIRDTKTRVWEPSVLVRKSADEEASVSDAVALPATTVGVNDEVVEVTSMVAHLSAEILFIGKEDGTVATYSAASGVQESVLYSHGPLMVITLLALGSEHILASADASGQVNAYALEDDGRGGFKAGQRLLDIKLHQVTQMLLSKRGDRLLCSTPMADTLWAVSGTGNSSPLFTISRDPEIDRLWTNLPASPDLIGLFTDSELHTYLWTDLLELHDHLKPRKYLSFLSAPEDMIDCNQLRVRSLAPARSGAANILMAEYSLARRDTTYSVVAWNLNTSPTPQRENGHPPHSPKSPGHPCSRLPPLLHFSASEIRHFLGLTPATSNPLVVYLDHDFWVCSQKLHVDSDYCVTKRRRQHFFIPQDFVSRNGAVLAAVTRNSDLAFAKGGEIVIVKCALD
jgi:WD40 repeat protein